MKLNLWLQTAAFLAMTATPLGAHAQGTSPNARLTGLNSKTNGASSTQMLSSGSQAIVFGSATVGSLPQTLTATFSVTGEGSGFIPQVALHYGHEYSVSSPQCSSTDDGETCSVDVTFTPLLPGDRPDALFVSDGNTRLSAFLLDGTGNAPYALFQATTGAVSSPLGQTATPTDGVVVDENGTVYALNRALGTVTSITAAGVSAVLPSTVAGGARSFFIDGAGILYLLPTSADTSAITYDTVQNKQGTLTLPVPASAIDALAPDGMGDIYALSTSSQLLYTLHADKTVTSAPLQQLTSASEPSTVSTMVFAANHLFSGATSLRQISLTGAQSQLALQSTATTTAFTPLGIDAASNLYVSNGISLLELSAPQYASAAATLPPAAALASNGALYLANGNQISMLNRSQMSLDFGSLGVAAGAQTRTATIYNAGNQPLVLSSIALQGEGYALASASDGNCYAGMTVAVGASCALDISFESSKTGSYDGAITVTSNSLNNVTSAQSMSVHADISSASQASLSPASLAFPSTTVNVASSPLTLTLSNPGSGTLDISSIGISGIGSGSYSLTQNCGTSLAATSSCTITVTFKPLSAATQSATVTVLDDAAGVAGSTQTATLSGTGTPAPAPVITFSPTSLTFGSATTASAVVVANNTSVAQTVTITNTGNAVANISTLTLTTTNTTLPFTNTTTCGSTLAVSASCTVSVTFSPTAAGTFPADIVLADNAVGSPQSVAITGIASADDYTVTSPDSAGTVSISASTGGSVQVPITASPDPGPFLTPVVFTVFGLPSGATYTFTPASLSPTTAAASTTLNITVPPYRPITLSSAKPVLPMRGNSLPFFATVFVGLFLGARRRKFTRLTRGLLMLLAALGMTSFFGCSGVPIATGTTPGSYTITVTAQSANGQPTSVLPLFPTSTHTVSFTLNVQ